MMVETPHGELRFTATHVMIAVAALGVVTGLVAWGIRIERTAAIEITRNDVFERHDVDAVRRIEALEQNAGTMVRLLEGRVLALEKLDGDINRRIDTIDTKGTRALLVIENRQKEVIMRLDRLERRSEAIDNMLREVTPHRQSPVRP